MDEDIAINEITWDEAKDNFKHHNPTLYAIIEELSPSKKLKFVHMTYSFGDLVVKDGILQPPPATSKTSQLFSSLNLDYSPIPLSLLVDKSCEVYVMENERVIPLKVFSAGALFGTFETIDYLFGQQRIPPWNITAGSRSIFTLPKISEQGGLKRIKNNFKSVQSIDILSLKDHWNLFKQISQDRNFVQPWNFSIITFPESWFSSLRKKDKAWFAFQAYLFKNVWEQSRQLFIRDALATQWQLALKAITQRRIQPTPYIIDTLKHFLFIFNRQAPLFHPIGDSDLLAPVEEIQRALLEIYRLKKYMPTMMAAKQALNVDRGYYSLAFPTLIEGSPDTKCNVSTMMADLKNIKASLETLRKTENTANYLKEVELDFFHVEQDKEGEILSSQLIPEKDKRFKLDPNVEHFCFTSAFWRGCVMVRLKACSKSR